jgi:hypothetical protein
VARAFVRGCNLKSIAAWTAYCKSGKKPPGIPAGPSAVYANDGWIGWGDWLGTGRVARGTYRPFKKARDFVRRLGLRSRTEWLRYCRSAKRPADIPSRPERTYGNDGWAGIGDWLGTGRVARGKRRTFKKARAYARSLKLKSVTEWFDYCRSDRKPADIPSNANSVYANDGWAGWGDWLATGRIPHGEYRPFKKAREFARGRRLKSEAEWRAYLRSGKKPADVPATPASVYANDGWVGWGDWLGTGRVTHGGQRSFKDARDFVRRLGLKSSDEWLAYCRSGKRPGDIPSNPYKTYAKVGWNGMGDWLGTGRIAPALFEHRSFKKAREFTRSLDLKSETEWRSYCRSGKKPADIPTNPHRTYAEAGWVGMGDWLGTGRVAAPRRRESEARTVV